jgi:hypothetical protein
MSDNLMIKKPCEGCGNIIFTPRDYCAEGIYTCAYCGERYKQICVDIPELVRVSETQLPIVVSVETHDYATVDLRHVVARFNKADDMLNAALKEYKYACRLYEAARPYKPKGGIVNK